MCADHGYVLFHNPVITCSCKCIQLLTAVMQISNPLHPRNCCGRRDSREDRPDPLVGEGASQQSSHHVHCIHSCKCNQLLTCVLPLIKERKRGKTGIASSCMGGRRCGKGAPARLRPICSTNDSCQSSHYLYYAEDRELHSFIHTLCSTYDSIQVWPPCFRSLHIFFCFQSTKSQQLCFNHYARC